MGVREKEECGGCIPEWDSGGGHIFEEWVMNPSWTLFEYELPLNHLKQDSS